MSLIRIPTTGLFPMWKPICARTVKKEMKIVIAKGEQLHTALPAALNSHHESPEQTPLTLSTSQQSTSHQSFFFGQTEIDALN